MTEPNVVKIETATLVVAKAMGDMSVLAKTVADEDVEDVLKRNTVGEISDGDADAKQD